MEVGEKLKGLNMTADEIDRFTKAFKDEKFREMLRDYAQALADPENKRRYEEDITILEKERGNNIEFIHPEPFKSLKTSVNGKQRCYVNICANEKVGKPECKWGESEDGRRGHRWTLPYSLHPGRQDRDGRGNQIMIYDVVFHPDTLHMARNNTQFMDVVISTAIQGIQDGFKVTLDKKNVREMKNKYKGVPQPCVIRKPIPGYQPVGPSLFPPFPDDKTSSSISPATQTGTDAKVCQSDEPTKPNYIVKYRSFIDLQDFRCSRDSGKTPRPKEIVVTIEVPLLESVRNTNLEVKEKSLLLESQDPAYRLELPLSYPVDEERGEAKFDKKKGQLTVTLPVLPPDEAFVFSAQAGDEKEEQDGSEDEDHKEEEEEQTREARMDAEDRVTGREIVEAEKGAEGQEGDETCVNEVEEEKSKEQENEEELGELAGSDWASQEVDDKSTAVSLIRASDEEVIDACEKINDQKVKVEQDAGEESEKPTVTKINLNTEDDCESSKVPAPRDPDNTVIPDEEDEDDLPTEQIIGTSDENLPPILLREIDKDGNETVISDHSTSAGVVFQNSLVFELD
ncbi:protein kintoun-like [Aulostomus maculatus]